MSNRVRAEPMGLQQLALVLEDLQPLFQLLLDVGHRRLDAFLGQHEMLRGVNVHLLAPLDHLAADGIDDRKLLDLVAPELDAEGGLLGSRPDLDAIAPHAKLTRLKLEVVPLILDIYQPGEHVIAIDRLPDFQPDHHRPIILGRPQPVDARDACHHDHVPPAHQRTRRGQPQPFDLLIDRSVLLDVDVALRNVRLRLIIIVIADEVMDGVMREELLELRIELSGQRLVMRHDQRRPLHILDHVGHRKGLARAGNAHQHLLRLAAAQPFRQRLDGLRLIAGGLEGGFELEHSFLGLPQRLASR